MQVLLWCSTTCTWKCLMFISGSPLKVHRCASSRPGKGGVQHMPRDCMFGSRKYSMRFLKKILFRCVMLYRNIQASCCSLFWELFAVNFGKKNFKKLLQLNICRKYASMGLLDLLIIRFGSEKQCQSIPILAQLGPILDIIGYRDICHHLWYFSQYWISNSCNSIFRLWFWEENVREAAAAAAETTCSAFWCGGGLISG